MWQKIKCWLGLELNTYLVSYNFKDKEGSGFGRAFFKANMINKKVIELWEHQIKIDLGENSNVVILNVVRLDND